MIAAQCPLIDPGPTPDPGPSPDPIPGEELFFDDFEDGLDPSWSETEGWTVQEGVLHRSSRNRASAYLEVGKDWQDYEVEVDIDARDESAGVYVRCSEDFSSYVLVYASHDYFRWYVVIDNETVNKDEYISPGLFMGIQPLRIVAEGLTVAVHVGDLHRFTIACPGIPEGMPGLYAYGNWAYSWNHAALIDNFRVTALE